MLRHKHFFRRLGLFLVILGPGIITGSVDNDAGGITTYSVAGAVYGYNLLWTLIPSFIVLLVIQEMNARMGIVTGKGLADLIRENAGVKITFFIFHWPAHCRYREYDNRVRRYCRKYGNIRHIQIYFSAHYGIPGVDTGCKRHL